MTSEIHTLFAYLGSRRRQAESTLDELRQRALELVIAGCVSEAAGLPVARPASGPVLPADLPEPTDPGVPLWSADAPGGRESKTEADVDFDTQPAADDNPVGGGPRPPVSREPPPEPVRGSWGPPAP